MARFKINRNRLADYSAASEFVDIDQNAFGAIIYNDKLIIYTMSNTMPEIATVSLEGTSLQPEAC